MAPVKQAGVTGVTQLVAVQIGMMLKRSTNPVLGAHAKLDCDKTIGCAFKRCSFGVTVSWERQHLVGPRAKRWLLSGIIYLSWEERPAIVVA